jgi:glycerol-3-phosphate acyltransferase PlsY
MAFLYSIFLGAGVAAFVYSRFGRRVGYGNTQNVATVVGVVFVLSTIVALTIFITLLHI